jgi:predicted alpha/beta hydrolase
MSRTHVNLGFLLELGAPLLWWDSRHPWSLVGVGCLPSSPAGARTHFVLGLLLKLGALALFSGGTRVVLGLLLELGACPLLQWDSHCPWALVGFGCLPSSPVRLNFSLVSCWSWVLALLSGSTQVLLGLLLELGICPLLWWNSCHPHSLVGVGCSPSSLAALTLFSVSC